MSIGKLSTRLVEKRQLAKNAWWFELEFSEKFNFKAGQYVSVKVNEEGDRRAYYIASIPGGKKIGLLVDVAPGGVGSKYFLGITVGDEVEVLGPLGRFVVEKTGSTSEQIPNGLGSDEKPSLVFVGTGSGIAPLRSMIDDLLQKKTGSTSKQSPEATVSDEKPVDIGLMWGMRCEEDVFWQEEFEALERKHKNFKFDLVLSRPGGSWQGRKGHVTDVLKEMENLKGIEFYFPVNPKEV